MSVVTRIAQDCIDRSLIRERMLYDATIDEVCLRRPKEKSSDTAALGLDIDVTALLGLATSTPVSVGK